MIAQLFVCFHATFEVFHHRQCVVILGFQFSDALVQGVLVGQALFLQKLHGLCHNFEIVFREPTLIAEVYAAPLTAGTTLEDIYRTFNVDHPADFKGHSLSVSDVVVLHQNGQDTAHYCDSVGFQQVPEFLRENPLRTAELSTEQNENMIDGVLNNAPSLGELEAKAKAGEQISLTDLAAAVKAEEKAPKAKKSRAAKTKKPSIRAQLDAANKEQSKQTPPREKTKELEV